MTDLPYFYYLTLYVNNLRPYRNQSYAYDIIKVNQPKYIVQINNFVYTGQIIDGLPDGYGKAMSFQNGQFHAAYEGLWKKGMPNPFGGLKTAYDSAYNGSYYYGFWENGAFLGNDGEYRYPEGSKFKGNVFKVFRSNWKNGHSIFITTINISRHF